MKLQDCAVLYKNSEPSVTYMASHFHMNAVVGASREVSDGATGHAVLNSVHTHLRLI